MSIGIYKITNQLNNKSYIGQSIHIEHRWKEHQRQSANSVIAKTIRKVGIENFTFEILEICSPDDLDERESYWMNFYNSIAPNGYNITDITSSRHTSFSHFNKEELNGIIQDIKFSDMTFLQIAQKYKINTSTVSRINWGQVHHQSDEEYPLRKQTALRRSKNNKIEYNFCVDCHTKISDTAIRCKACDGKFRKQQNLQKLPVTREELKKLIRTTPFTKIGEMFTVNDNAIRKWCDNFQLPRRVSEIKKYTDDEWENI